MKDLMENNPSYPNLTAQYTIDEKIGKEAMATLDPVAIPFGILDQTFNPTFKLD